MSSRLPQFQPSELIRALEKLGFVQRRQTGSHVILRHPQTKKMAVVPVHAKDIKRGLLFGILKQSWVTPEELLKIL